MNSFNPGITGNRVHTSFSSWSSSLMLLKLVGTKGSSAEAAPKLSLDTLQLCLLCSVQSVPYPLEFSFSCRPGHW